MSNKSVFISKKEFIGLLPKIIQDKKDLRALFCTYSAIRDYPRGEVQTNKKGLYITVSSDSESGVIARLRDTVSSTPLGLQGPISSPTMKGMFLAGEKQSQVEECFLEEKAGDFYMSKNILFVVYMGLNAFDATVDFLYFLRENYSHAKIITLTCDCNRKYKENITSKLHKEGIIDVSVITNLCGGRSVMQEMLRALIDAWPEK